MGRGGVRWPAAGLESFRPPYSTPPISGALPHHVVPAVLEYGEQQSEADRVSGGQLEASQPRHPVIGQPKPQAAQGFERWRGGRSYRVAEDRAKPFRGFSHLGLIGLK